MVYSPFCFNHLLHLFCPRLMNYGPWRHSLPIPAALFVFVAQHLDGVITV